MAEKLKKFGLIIIKNESRNSNLFLVNFIRKMETDNGK